MIEAAAIDGASPARRFWTDRLPATEPDDLLPAGGEPCLRLLRHLRDHPRHHLGGPADATSILVYRVYSTGFVGQDYGSIAPHNPSSSWRW
jgi:sn-glycerol 3-phosphate transport system permease protein